MVQVMRVDKFLSNDGGSYSILSSAAVLSGASGRDDSFKMAKDCQMIHCCLVGDDAFVVRVVAGEPLRDDEASQWITRVTRRLKVPCGKLLVCSTYDPQWSPDEEERQEVREFDMPKGDYLVDVYTYLHTMNGRVLVETAWNEKLGAWFRHDHPSRPFPSWVAAELVRSPEDDPGHEAKWRHLARSVKSGALRVSLDPLHWIGVLVHLRPWPQEDAVLTPISREAAEDYCLPGAIPPETGLRRPAVFPLGISTKEDDHEFSYALRPIL